MLTLTPSCEDAELVRQSLGRDRDAYGRIVAKYQALVCALTYSACGDLQASEDLAQATFVTGWRRLAFLDEPEKLRRWLCGIARHLCADFLRAKRRARTASAGDGVMDARFAAAASPAERAIREEEKAILWRAVRALPASLREPVVLFYRQDRSVREVAEALELSEVAVRQRLARGREMLRESLSGFVESALRRSGPDKQFTAAVLAALPLNGVAAHAAVAGSAATKVAKVAAVGSASNAAAVFAPPAMLGALVGWRMNRDAAGSAHGRAAVRAFWRAASISIVLAVIPPLLLTFPLVHRFPDHRERILWAMTRWMGVSFAGVLFGLVLWLRGRRRAKADEPTTPAKRRSIRYPLIAMSLAALILVALYGFLDNARVRIVTPAEARRLAESDPQASLFVQQSTNGARGFVVGWPQKRQFVLAPMDASLEELVRESKKPIPVLVQGRDFEVLGWPGRMLPLLCVFVIGAGVVVVVGRRAAPVQNAPATA